MKKFAIIMALLLFETQLTVGAATTYANYNKKPAQKTQVKKVNTQKVQPAKENDYLLKYNINDLEAAPWLNGGKRKI